LVFDHEKEHPSRWAAVLSIAAKIGCTAQTLNEWVKKAEVDSGLRVGLPTKATDRKASAYFARRATTGSSHDRLHRRSRRASALFSRHSLPRSSY
jgi:transposase